MILLKDVQAWIQWVPLCCLTLASAMSANEIASYFLRTLSPAASVYLTSDPATANATTRRWNLWSAPNYIVSVKPATRADVEKVIQYASETKTPFLTTGGGHGYSGTLGAVDSGVQLDMSNFNSVTVDDDKNLMTAGASLRFKDLAAAAHAKGKAITIGACSCVGIGGATLGGGIGFYSGLYGTLADSLSSVELVAGTGEVLVASDTQNQELFWGTKGAGFNFGTVTSFTYRVHEEPNGGMVMNADMTFIGAQNAFIWEFSKKMLGAQPPELSLVFATRYDPAKGDIATIVNAIYAGPLEEGKPLLEHLLKHNPANVVISYIPWPEAPDTAVYGITKMTCASSYTYIPHAINLYSINVQALVDLTKYVYETASTTPAVQGTLFTFTQYASQGFSAHTDAEQAIKGRVGSAFPYRDPTVFVQVDGLSFDPSFVSALDDLGKEIRTRLLQSSGQKSLELYVNFARGDEGAHAWYGGKENLSKLQKLKIRYDPRGLFSFYNPVPAALGP